MVPSPKRPPSGTNRRLTRLAALLGLLCVAGGALAAVWAYRTQRAVLVAQIGESHLDQARALGAYLAHSQEPRQPGTVADVLARAWSRMDHVEDDSAVCLVGPDGRLVYHSKRPDAIGSLVGDEKLFHPDPAVKTYGDLLRERLDYTGIHHISGHDEIVAFAYQPELSSLVGIHIPVSTVEHHFWHASRPWVGVLGVVLGILLPLAMVLLHRAYVGSQRETERLLETEQAMQARLVQSERMAAVGTLAAGVAHEINNPLAYVIGNLEFLGRAMKASGDGVAGDARLTEALADARDGAERVRRIVGDLGSFSRSPEEAVTGPVDVHQTIEHAVSVAANEVRHRAQLVRRFAEVPPVLADPSRLEQVFLNLIINAAQAIPVGDAEGNRIVIETRRGSGDTVEIRIHDTGSGMSAETQARAVEPFFTTKPQGEGSGLGLYVCQSIVGAFGGALTFQSQEGDGTTAVVTLPVAPPAEAPAPAAEPPPRAPGEPARILVIDDEENLGVSLQRVLEGTHEVVVETSGDAALARLADDDRFDVVLCDLMMPDVTGMDVYATIARDHPRLAGRVVFTTGGAFTEEARRFLAEVDNPRLQKPFRVEQLEALVDELTGTGAASAEPSGPAGPPTG